MPFFALFVLLVWSVMLRDRWQLLGAAVVGSFLVQAHLGYAPLVGTAFLVATASVLLDARRARDTLGRWARPLATSVGVTLVLWLPTIWEQLTGDPGNLTLIARYFRESPEGQIGLRAGAGTFAALYRPVPVWLGGPEHFVPLTFQPRPESRWWLLVPAVLLAVAAVVAVRARLAAEVRLVALVGTLTVVGVVALSRVKEEAWTYMSLWRLPLAILVVAVTGWTLWRAWSAPPPLARTLGIVVLCGAVLGGAVPISRDILGRRHVASFHDDVAAVVDQVRDRTVDQPLLVRNVAPALRGVAPTIVDVLDRRGVDVRVDPRGGRAWGSQRTATLDQVDRVWIVTEDGMRGAQLRAVPGARVIARTSPLPARDERELSRLQRDLAQQLYDVNRSDLVPWLDYRDFVPLVAKEVPEIDSTKLARVEALVRRAVALGGCRCTVVELRPDELPGALTDG
jgi:hypothetical protein